MALTRPAPGEWTYDDLLALPDDGRRWEIIEGVLYEMPPVSWIESATKIGLVLPFFDAVESRGGWMIVSPLWVFLPGAEPVQPDALVVLPGGGSMPSDRGLEGPPDLIVEIVSPPQPRPRSVDEAVALRAGRRARVLADRSGRAHGRCADALGRGVPRGAARSRQRRRPLAPAPRGDAGPRRAVRPARDGAAAGLTIEPGPHGENVA